MMIPTRRTTARPWAIGAIVLLALGACSSAPSATSSATSTVPAAVRVEGTWASVAGRDASIFFLLSNGTATDDRLIGAASPLAAGATITDGSRTIRSLALPAGSRRSFDGTRYGLVLTGLRRSLVPGDAVKVTLTFAHAVPVTFEAGVR